MLRKYVQLLVPASLLLLVSASGAAAQTTNTQAQAPPVPRLEIYGFVMTDAGFGQISYRNLSGGIAAIHSGWRL